MTPEQIIAQTKAIYAASQRRREHLRAKHTTAFPLERARELAQMPMPPSVHRTTAELVSLLIDGRMVAMAINGTLDPAQPKGVAQLSDPAKVSETAAMLHADMKKGEAFVSAVRELRALLKPEGLDWLLIPVSG
jgi:hypothetical protein